MLLVLCSRFLSFNISLKVHNVLGVSLYFDMKWKT